MKRLEKLRNRLFHGYNINKERPFVCDGSPYECQVFLVGINPAFGFEESFWDFWDNSTGFHLDSWIDDFKSSRKNERSELTRTREMIEHFRCKLKSYDISLLDLNLYLKPTARANALTSADKNTDVFDFLVNEIKPRLILLHGNPPRQIFESKLGHKIEKNRFHKCVSYTLYARNHLSYQTSRVNISEIAKEISRNLR